MFSYSLLIPPLLLLFSIFVTSTAAGDKEAAFSTTTLPSVLCADGTCSLWRRCQFGRRRSVVLCSSSTSTLKKRKDSLPMMIFTTSIYTLLTPPLNWEQMTFSELRDYFDCSEHAYDLNKALPTLNEWMVLQQQYRELVDSEPLALLKSVVPPTLGYSHGSSSDSSSSSSSVKILITIFHHPTMQVNQRGREYSLGG